MSNIYRTVFCIVFLLLPCAIFAESEGGTMFMRNMPSEAIPLLERDIENGTAEPEDYNFLGLAYYQIGDLEKSIAAFEAGISTEGTDKRVLAFNAGNVCFAAEEFEKAEKHYSAAIADAPDFKEAILNRANAVLRQDNLESALKDYEMFLEKSDDDENSELVNKMIAILKIEIELRKETNQKNEIPPEKVDASWLLPPEEYDDTQTFLPEKIDSHL